MIKSNFTNVFTFLVWSGVFLLCCLYPLEPPIEGDSCVTKPLLYRHNCPDSKVTKDEEDGYLD